MTEADKLYELALALRAKATQGEWHNESKNFSYGARHVCGQKHADGGDYAPITITDTEANASLIVAAVNLLAALPKLRAEWEREARLYEAKWWRGRADGIHKHDCVCVICERIAAFQQPAAQEEEERT